MPESIPWRRVGSLAMPASPAFPTGQRLVAPVAASAALTLVIFILDLYTPLGYAIWALYMIVLLTVPPRRWVPAAAALICAGLTLWGFFLSPPGIPAPLATLNRVVGITVLGAVAALLEWRLRTEARVTALTVASHSLAGSLDLQVILDALLECISALIPYDSANVMLLQDGEFVVAAHRGYESRSDGLITGLRLNAAEGGVGEVCRTRQALVIAALARAVNSRSDCVTPDQGSI